MPIKQLMTKIYNILHDILQSKMLSQNLNLCRLRWSKYYLNENISFITHVVALFTKCTILCTIVQICKLTWLFVQHSSSKSKYILTIYCWIYQLFLHSIVMQCNFYQFKIIGLSIFLESNPQIETVEFTRKSKYLWFLK